jgi:uncharacterized membrane protein YphA (DoxX/SURF4 family)
MDRPEPAGLAFIAAGAMKLFAYEKYKIMSEKKGPTGLTRSLITFIGIVELAGGLGVVLPMAKRLGLDCCTRFFAIVS